MKKMTIQDLTPDDGGPAAEADDCVVDGMNAV